MRPTDTRNVNAVPTVTYLVGPPASGKRTIGLELAAATGAALIDNHLINDPIFTAYGADGASRLPEWVYQLAGKVRESTMEAAMRAAPDVSHIFTNYLSADPAEAQYVENLRTLAQTRGAQFVPVWLTCPENELARRVTLPQRQTRRKMHDPDSLRQLLLSEGALPPPSDALILNTAELAPHQAARRIIEQAAHVAR